MPSGVVNYSQLFVASALCRRYTMSMEKPGVRRRLSAAGIRQRRMAAAKHAKYAQVVTPEEVTRYRLEKIDPEAPEVIEKFTRAVGGDLSALDSLRAAAMAGKELIRRRMVDEVATRGVVLEEVLFNSEGTEVGRRVRPNPMLETLKHADEQLGYTAEQAQLSPKARGQRTEDELLRFMLLRDAEMRAMPKPNLPPPDPELFRGDARPRVLSAIDRARAAAAEQVRLGKKTDSD